MDDLADPRPCDLIFVIDVCEDAIDCFSVNNVSPSTNDEVRYVPNGSG